MNCSITAKINQTVYRKIKGCDKHFPSSLDEFRNQTKPQAQKRFFRKNS